MKYRAMMKINNISKVGLVATAYLLGCISFVFLCFTGVAQAFLWDKGIDSTIIKTVIKHVPKGDARVIAFTAYSGFEYIVINLLVSFLFVYFLSEYFVRRLMIYSVIVTIGAVTTDFYYFKKYTFGLSRFFSENYDIRFLNLFVWFTCTGLSIKTSSFLKKRRVLTQHSDHNET